ncbi:MAG: tryptophan--tRNA ligase, partial [Bacteroidales bacterium]|nr:tryptophan--tRNA ligase [Bacteroidales bacterium]
IILYDSNVVPVGIDQKQHVELARDIAVRMNNRYGELFVVPEPIIAKVGAKIKDLQDPTKKMSKSNEDPMGTIFLLDSESDIKKKINRAVTDNDGYVAFDEEKKPGISNLITIYAALSHTPLQEAIDHFTGMTRYGDFKKEVLEVIYETLRPIQAEYQKLAESNYVDQILDQGRDRANEIANKKYDLVRRAVGFGR